jgi:hypothetical protein
VCAAGVARQCQSPRWGGKHRLKADPNTRHIGIVAFAAFAIPGDEEAMRAAGRDGFRPDTPQ